MNHALGPLVSRLIPEDRMLGARLGVMEAVRAGATTICEYASHVETLIEGVYQPLGVHCVAVETINEVLDDRSALGISTRSTTSRGRQHSNAPTRSTRRSATTHWSHRAMACRHWI